MSYLLETGILLHAARDSEAFREIDAQFHLRDGGFQPTVSVVSVGEIKPFAVKRNWGESKLNALDRLVSNLVVIPIDLGPVVEKYAELQGRNAEDGLNVGQNDVWIAATAVASQLTILTLDQDFARLPNQVRFVRFDGDTGAALEARSE